MLAGYRRITRADQYRSVMRGVRAGTSTVVVHVGPVGQDNLQTLPAGPARAGFVVGKAIGGAVHRNRLRRQMRHLMADQLDRVPDGLGVVVRALPEAGEAPWPRVKADLVAGLDRCLARVERAS